MNKDLFLRKKGKELFTYLNQYVDLESDSTYIFSSTNSFNVLNCPNGTKAIVNLSRLNDIRYINKFMEEVNSKLQKGDYYVGCLETFAARRTRKYVNRIPVLNLIYFGMEYVFMRVWPKLPILKQVYFFITRGRNRLLSKAEALGRTVSCGFEIVDFKSIDGYLYFITRKVANPEFNMNPSYGPLFKMARMGKDKKIIRVYKVRTMYAYAEYLQKYIYDKHGTSNGDKAINDFRVSTFGKILRKCWIDEIPMLYNLIKGDIKLIGPRPLSVPKFNMYPIYAQEKRSKFKPGLIPPFYFDLPETFDELIASEIRYLDSYERSPILTDIRYLIKAMYNIILKGARSK